MHHHLRSTLQPDNFRNVFFYLLGGALADTLEAFTKTIYINFPTAYVQLQEILLTKHLCIEKPLSTVLLSNITTVIMELYKENDVDIKQIKLERIFLLMKKRFLDHPDWVDPRSI